MITLDTLEKWAPLPLVLVWMLIYSVAGFELVVVALLAILVCDGK